MSSWTRVSFSTGTQSVAELQANLTSALDDPDTLVQDDVLVWKADDDVDAQRLTELGIEAPQALVLTVSDTSNGGNGCLYERVDGEFIAVDAIDGGEHLGRDLIAYMQREHDIVGVRK